jgi:hypothetical protein
VHCTCPVQATEETGEDKKETTNLLQAAAHTLVVRWSADRGEGDSGWVPCRGPTFNSYIALLVMSDTMHI